ncbi:MAG: phosphoribosylamine--glycine ligase [Candidatus Portnoybacteria bacterium CG_4_8_14_3_um_filter_44_10]|uniref:phosphoribosylamine--glycine ligase n=5 Tax=Candidatus Portnoyibacteriota TaxID=1817913 RepID=A0A2H0KSJ8_9BACT|nr:MAG: phosphoribosylamine--glycine ligase [Candidatus Portnoybacteria bacterium CG11_big_fil_rev_8_21_14_0_20_44_10]PIS16140.1 MAG: phosphoribosylamine--glycine ligase [Candidatus Portnoybacteria bacterium CG09_land_8_20_14_0_10_44_13]PIW75784.1 MAG: phosphoribosylamine--glycine ligase [Candidatus Portnoybacteria bacterium CG_4_8_14_3_um_filter_44_10]PIZ69939.1 MAG: phosphoribosylamine--glycine ligase [Candidatus Portnoybacteria bacterium CG_4_10_14_0_2_um_filter_44_20]PJA63475.1 MAG: phospho
MGHKFLFVSKDALINDIAWQTVKEGHDVKYFIEEKGESDITDGFVPKTENWEQEIEWADVIVFDDVLGHGTKAEKLRKAGKKVVGGTAYTDRLEDDRAFGQEELKNHGVKILPYREFTDFDEAINYIRTNPDEYVIKPCGEAANYKGLLFVGQEKDGSDVIRVMEAYKRVWSKVIKTFQLQRKVRGVEIAVGAFFTGKEFVYPISINFEHKKLFVGNIGPATGEMGTSMFWTGQNRLFNETLKKLEGKLAEENYIGYIDINCIVNGQGIYPLEFTCRFGYPTISIQQEGIINPIGEVLYALANGENPNLQVKKGFQVGVRVVVPPFPFKDKKIFDSYSKEATIVFKQKNGLDGIHIEDVKIINNQWVVTGSTGTALIVVGTGLTMREAKKQAYARIQNILIPNMYYRTDIGDRWYEEGDKLRSWDII